MNIKDVAKLKNEVNASVIFKTENSIVTAINIQKGGLLKEHITKTTALLLCVNGVALFENENGEAITLKHGDFLEIKPMIKHWVKGIEDSNLILVK